VSLEVTRPVQRSASARRFERAIRPQAVTIVGASPESAPTQQLIANLRRPDCRFAGRINLVNERRACAGEPGYVASMSDVDGPLGLVYVMLSGEAALAAVESISRAADGVVVYGGGFADAGRGDLESRLAAWGVHDPVGSSGRSPSVLGPQSVGVYLAAADFFGLTAPVPGESRGGAVAIVSQSGALIGAFMRTAFSRGVGISHAVALGNGFATGAEDVCTALLAEDDVEVLCVYLERTEPLSQILAIGATAARSGKTVLLAVGGLSEAGSAVAQSHTGALASDRRLIEGVARQGRVILVRDFEELLWGAEAVQAAPSVPLADEVAVVGLTGGGVILVADALEAEGVRLRPPSPRHARALRRRIPAPRSLNPLDGGAGNLGNRAVTAELLHYYATDPRYGIIVCVAGMGLPPPTDQHAELYRIFEREVSAAGKLGVLASVLPDSANGAWSAPGIGAVRGNHEAAVKVRLLRDWARTRSRRVPDAPKRTSARSSSAGAIARPAPDEGDLPPVITGERAQAMLKRLPLRWPASFSINGVGELAALEVADLLPAVAKAEGLAHRSRVGGICRDLKDLVALESAVSYLASSFGYPVSVVADVPHDRGYIIGVRRRQTGEAFGVFGIGGIEVGNDVQLALLPLDRSDARALVGQFVRRPSERVVLAGVVYALQEFVSAIGTEWISTIELNPVVIGPGGEPFALDCKIFTTLGDSP
jgi:acyl-CoA synthetase (NDP forming)